MSNDEGTGITDAPGMEEVSPFERVIETYASEEQARDGLDLLGGLVQKEQYVGEVYSLGYESALVQIHDSFRQQVGGIPSLSFLVATRLPPGVPFDHKQEDS